MPPADSVEASPFAIAFPLGKMLPFRQVRYAESAGVYGTPFALYALLPLGSDPYVHK